MDVNSIDFTTKTGARFFFASLKVMEKCNIFDDVGLITISQLKKIISGLYEKNNDNKPEYFEAFCYNLSLIQEYIDAFKEDLEKSKKSLNVKKNDILKKEVSLRNATTIFEKIKVGKKMLEKTFLDNKVDIKRK